ncbi:hypothetical protein TNCV_126861 [Trichonephila clavipes]|nr:hypothetical protein TNCV_126861 [Trichonephila clavipes]
MASNNDLPTDMDFQNPTLPKSGNSTPKRPSRPTSCARLEDEHDPTFVEMVKQCSMYEDLLEKAVSEFGNLPYCDTLGCPVHETPTSSPVKSQPTKRKDEDGFTSPPGKVSKNNLTHK